jgi:hypothetical protein
VRGRTYGKRITDGMRNEECGIGFGSFVRRSRPHPNFFCRLASLQLREKPLLVLL